MYADDMILFCWADSIQLDVDNLQLSFNALQEALIELKLVLNADKTKYMLFTKAKAINYANIQISTLHGLAIERVSHCKNLGFWIDDKFTFKVHVDILAKKSVDKTGLSLQK